MMSSVWQEMFMYVCQQENQSSMATTPINAIRCIVVLKTSVFGSYSPWRITTIPPSVSTLAPFCRLVLGLLPGCCWCCCCCFLKKGRVCVGGWGWQGARYPSEINILVCLFLDMFICACWFKTLSQRHPTSVFHDSRFCQAFWHKYLWKSLILIVAGPVHWIFWWPPSGFHSDSIPGQICLQKCEEEGRW